MRVPETTVLGYALMGLLHQKAQSGYELRKVFATTPIGCFSDSPGSIYPALGRLERRRWIRGANEAADNPRQRKRFSLTAAGLAELKRWLAQPVTSQEVASAHDRLWLRCAFVQQVLGMDETLRFLREAEREMSTHLAGLREYRRKFISNAEFSSGQLAFECGLAGVAVSLRGIRRAIQQIQTDRNSL
jgi:DNA-binding PadR family transcriptional regulator